MNEKERIRAEEEVLAAIRSEPHGSFGTYIFTYLASIVLTVLSFLGVHQQWLSGWNLITMIGFFAALQAIVQLAFFLHLADEPAPRYNTLFFLFMGMIVTIIGAGTLWIMFNLNMRVMPEM